MAVKIEINGNWYKAEYVEKTNFIIEISPTESRFFTEWKRKNRFDELFLKADGHDFKILETEIEKIEKNKVFLTCNSIRRTNEF